MAKLKNIIKQLSAHDFQTLCDQLRAGNAEKSALLLRFIRERQMSDEKIMKELDVNTNAYYTLRSRLNQKIEEYLLQQMENPRTDLLKKVANISEVVFTKKRAIAIATLKKLEKELLDYDLANELTVVYKNLKKLHINSPDSFSYSQLYNRHVAYMLALDKCEDLLADYFKKYGSYLLTGNEIEKMELDLLKRELDNVCKLYDSHRLYVYRHCVGIFHRFFVDTAENEEDEAVEDILANVEKTFETYYLDSVYYNLKPVFEYLKLEYYTHYKVWRKTEKYFEEVNENAATLLSNYSLYTFPAGFLLTKLDRAIRTETEGSLYVENKEIFEEFECDVNDVPKYLIYVCYRALSCFFAGKYDEAHRYLNGLLNDLSLKRFPQALIEVKLLLTLQYCLLRDFELFNQSVNSIQRQIRLLNQGDDHSTLFIKLMKTAITETRPGKAAKIKSMAEKIRAKGVGHFSPIMIICSDDRFLEKMV
ncbi:MAG: hypothetical protein V4543_11350 [Bacteroidota bacterium]